MKKAAIMTWFHYNNFGTALQVTALYNSIRKAGYEADVIHYVPHGRLVTLKDKKHFAYYARKAVRKITHVHKDELEIRDEKRNAAFEKFREQHITLTYKCRTASDLYRLNDLYDSFVCGSDLIWSPSWFNPKYFLDFVRDTDKMIAYAPSIGQTDILDPCVKKRMKESIERFRHLSVREEQGSRAIRQICGKDAFVALDPTFLLSADEWTGFASEGKSEEPYILSYFLGDDNEENWHHVKMLSEKIKIPVKVIPVCNDDYKRGFAAEDGVGPAEFIHLIRDAAFVCTDSFHGTIFSIIFKVPFYTYERYSNNDKNSRNSRIHNILQISGLKERLVINKSQVNPEPMDCRFEGAMERIEEEKRKSLVFLHDALSKSMASENHLSFEITNTCCGCGSCQAICDQGAVRIIRNRDGFWAAQVEQKKCTRCGVCVEVCPFNGETTGNLSEKEQALFAIRSREEKIRNASASGGAAYEIARMLHTRGYIISGCSYDAGKREASHEMAVEGEMLKLANFQGSKYIQSNSADLFLKAKNIRQKAAIFGTPCQISGMDKLLQKENRRDQFVLVDIVCRGIPTWNLWKKYLQQGALEHGYGLAPRVVFRDKSGGKKIHIRIEGNAKEYTCTETKDLFYRFYLLGHVYMPSCYECLFRRGSAADIRLGDFWEGRYREPGDRATLAAAFTAKGREVLEELCKGEQVESEAIRQKDIRSEENMENPIRPVFYEDLMKDLYEEETSLKDLADIYCLGFESDKIMKPVLGLYEKIKT
ncbi:polysaccharide pyruvyl transferase family protein [Parasporobacterium paucivorans]|uniref:Coenzyme F420-reducing hydrogenase, beta subunit n=1 Tax=Parasporobacterium paucivorans DSM 15970 TaxID=1122934 RepID=A0A1M6GW30_9FIRM|nr:polysaccharide pyruvyl transferase family protein [Parasporobacterium paucivorans]SHJ14115.1 Coenzyme F420-reducing hydrogenase, beta subunit [Parasporobacterium paucivorans DSM 15970]